MLEETGVEVTGVRVVLTRSGFQGRLEVLLTAEALPGSRPRADGAEVRGGEFLPLVVARERLRESHVALLAAVAGSRAAGLPTRAGL